jgi:lantibiotic modifying enzyme
MEQAAVHHHPDSVNLLTTQGIQVLTTHAVHKFTLAESVVAIGYALLIIWKPDY